MAIKSKTTADVSNAKFPQTLGKAMLVSSTDESTYKDGVQCRIIKNVWSNGVKYTETIKFEHDSFSNPEENGGCAEYYDYRFESEWLDANNVKSNYDSAAYITKSKRSYCNRESFDVLSLDVVERNFIDGNATTTYYNQSNEKQVLAFNKVVKSKTITTDEKMFNNMVGNAVLIESKKKDGYVTNTWSNFMHFIEYKPVKNRGYSFMYYWMNAGDCNTKQVFVM